MVAAIRKVFSTVEVGEYGSLDLSTLDLDVDAPEADHRLALRQRLGVHEGQRAWYSEEISEEISEARTKASGLYQVPVLPEPYWISGMGTLAPAAVSGE